MSGNEIDSAEVSKWDPVFTERLINAVTPIIKRWFRPEVRGLESFPATGGALVVSNHSGGVLTPDWNVLGRIQARTLVMHITNDQWLNFKLAERAVDRIPGAELISEESPVAHYGVFFTPFVQSFGEPGSYSRQP